MSRASSSLPRRDPSVCTSLWSRRPIGRIAVAVNPAKERIERHTAPCESAVAKTPRTKPVGYTDQWRASLVAMLASMRASIELPGVENTLHVIAHLIADDGASQSFWKRCPLAPQAA